MLEFHFDANKNKKLKKERGISFEEIISLIDEGALIDIIEHHNPLKYPYQKFYVIDVDAYIYLVPFEQKGNQVILKTIFPSRKATQAYLKKG